VQPLAFVRGKGRLGGREPHGERISLAFRVIALDRFLTRPFPFPCPSLRSLQRLTTSASAGKLAARTGNGRIRRKLVGDRPCIEL